MKMELLGIMVIFGTIIHVVKCGTTFYFEENSWKVKPYHALLEIGYEDKVLSKDHPFQIRAIDVFRNIIMANTKEMKQNDWTISVEKEFSYKPGKKYEEDYVHASASPEDGFIKIEINDVYFSEKIGMNDDQLACLLGTHYFLLVLLAMSIKKD